MSIGASSRFSVSKPITLPQDQQEMCDKLKVLYKNASINTEKNPQDMFEGARHALENRDYQYNKDHTAQAAHSLREILYPFFNNKTKKLGITITGEAEKIGSILPDEEKILSDIRDLNKELSDIAHHRKPETEEHLEKMEKNGGMIEYFKGTMSGILQFQTDVHDEIDKLI